MNKNKNCFFVFFYFSISGGTNGKTSQKIDSSEGRKGVPTERGIRQQLTRTAGNAHELCERKVLFCASINRILTGYDWLKQLVCSHVVIFRLWMQD